MVENKITDFNPKKLVPFVTHFLINNPKRKKAFQFLGVETFSVFNKMYKTLPNSQNPSQSSTPADIRQFSNC